MGSPIITAVAKARRKMRQDQRVPASAGVPMWRLLAGEAAYLVRELWRRPVLLVAIVVAILAALVGVVVAVT